MVSKGIAAAVMAIVVGLVTLGLVSDYLVDWLWFSSVGYFPVFRTILIAKAAMLVVVFVVSGLCFVASGLLAIRLSGAQNPWATLASLQTRDDRHLLRDFSPRLAAVARQYLVPAALVFALLIAVGETANWDTALRFFNRTPYGESDPIFGKDIGFYLFSLPAYLALLRWLYITLIGSALVAGVVYLLRGDVSTSSGGMRVSKPAIGHGSILLGIFLRSAHCPTGSTVTCFCTTTTMSWLARPTQMSTSVCRFSG
jgi:uncharacterized membrane protein (UPF0182 family)